MVIVKSPIWKLAGPAIIFAAGAVIFCGASYGRARAGDREAALAMGTLGGVLAGFAIWMAREARRRGPSLIADERSLRLYKSDGPPEETLWPDVVEIQHTYEIMAHLSSPLLESDGRPTPIFDYLFVLRRGPHDYAARIGQYDLERPVARIVRELATLPAAAHVVFVDHVPVPGPK